MLPALQLEFQKLRRYPTASIIVGLYAALFLFAVVTIYGTRHAGGLPPAQAYAFPTLWAKLATTGAGCTVLLAILFIILVTDDFQYRTFRQQFIDGATHGQLIGSKVAASLLLAGAGLVVLLAIGVGLGGWYAAGTWQPAPAQGAPVLLAGLQTLGFMALAGLVAIGVRKSGLSILLFVLYLFVVEPLLRSQLPAAVARWLPCRALLDLTPAPTHQELAGAAHAALPHPLYLVPVAAGYIAACWGLSYWLLRQRDL